MAKYYLLVCCLIITSCNTEKRNLDVNDDSITISESIPVTNAKMDTATRIFTLEGNFSAEGNEGKAFYKNNKIDKIEITFYGETGKAIYSYHFKTKEIAVSQQRFNYKTDFTEVKSANDISKSEEISFTTDLNGKIIRGDKYKADLDTFIELKKVVPFDLN